MVRWSTAGVKGCARDGKQLPIVGATAEFALSSQCEEEATSYLPTDIARSLVLASSQAAQQTGGQDL